MNKTITDILIKSKKISTEKFIVLFKNIAIDYCKVNNITNLDDIELKIYNLFDFNNIYYDSHNIKITKKKIYNTILKKYIPSDDILTDIIDNYIECLKIIDVTKFTNLIMSRPNIIVNILKTISNKKYNEQFITILKSVISIMDINVDSFHQIMNCELAIEEGLILDILNNYLNSNPDNKLNDILHINDIHCVLRSLMHNKHIFIQFVIINGINMDNDSLNIICNVCDYLSLDTFLQYTKIKPNTEHLKLLFKNYSINTDDYLNMVNLLLINGAIPDHEFLATSLLENADIPDLSNYNIKIDSEIYKLCIRKNTFPKWLFSSEMIALHKLCKQKKNVKKLIREHINKFNLIPDEVCMIYACSIPFNSPVIKLLTLKGGIITFECLLSIMNIRGTNVILRFAIQEFRKYQKTMLDNHEIEISNYQNQIIHYKNKINELETIINSNNNNNNNIQVNIDNNNNADNVNIDNKANTDNVNIDNNNNIQADNNIFDMSIHNDFIANINVNIKKDPSKQYIEFFKADKKKVSFIDVKKNIIKTIHNNKWICEYDNTLINLPSDIKIFLNIDNNLLIKFSDIDILVGMFV